MKLCIQFSILQTDSKSSVIIATVQQLVKHEGYKKRMTADR